MMADNTTSDRTLAPVRQPIETRTVGNAPDAQVAAGISTYERMSQRGYNRVIETYDVIPTQVQGDTSFANHAIQINNSQLADYGQPDLSVSNGVSNTGATQQPVTPAYLYDVNNPLGLVSDLFSRFYGGTPTESPQSPVVVGDTATGTSSGSNAGLFILIAIVGIVGYFVYRRMKQ